MLEPGVVVGGKYRLERPLGAGGMGAVWVARHTLLDVEIALKVMGPQVADVPEARSRFVREAKAVAQLKSPYIVQVHDFGGIDDTPYLAMELLSGEDLGSVIAHEHRLSLARTVEIAASIAKALRVAHEARIVHRDLKPTNIFLANVGGEQVVKVLDFGIAKVLAGADAGTTTSGAIIGSPAYMSPEQARGGALDERSDLWSLGAVVFEMLTGQQAFGGATIGDVIVEDLAATIRRSRAASRRGCRSRSMASSSASSSAIRSGATRRRAPSSRRSRRWRRSTRAARRRSRSRERSRAAGPPRRRSSGPSHRRARPSPAPQSGR